MLDKTTLAFADYSGNRQFITQGNLSENPKAHIFVMDYAHRRRVKIWGEARVVEDDPALTQSLMPQGYKARPEQVILFKIEAWDTNCPQHIPQKFDAADVAQALAIRDGRIAELEAELAALKGERSGALRGARKCKHRVAVPLVRGGVFSRPGSAEQKPRAASDTAFRPPAATAPRQIRIILLHHPVDIGGEIFEPLGLVAQFRIEERRQDSGEHAERGGVGAAGLVAHQIGLVAKLHRQREQRADREIDVIVRRMTAEAAQQIILGDPKLRVLAQLFAACSGAPSKKCVGPLAKLSGSTQRAPTSAQ